MISQRMIQEWDLDQDQDSNFKGIQIKIGRSKMDTGIGVQIHKFKGILIERSQTKEDSN